MICVSPDCEASLLSVLPVYDKMIPAILNDGVWNLPKMCTFTLGVPVGPVLAKPTKGVSEILSRFQKKKRVRL